VSGNSPLTPSVDCYFSFEKSKQPETTIGSKAGAHKSSLPNSLVP
jgi:hypothetical protein